VNEAVLNIWVVYDHPRDAPDFYVARRHEVGQGSSRPTESVMASPRLGHLRDILRSMGLVQLARNDEDDPVILESWL
jgi:hypothetical protein